MTYEQVLLFLQCISNEIGKNIDLFLINTSVFFFAHTYLQSKKMWGINLKKTTPEQLKWGEIVVFKENQSICVTDESLKLYPEWTILFPASEEKEISVSEYREYLEYINYNEAYEIKYASERKDRLAAFYGAVLLILGSYVSLQKNCGSILVAVLVLLIYVAMALVIIKVISYGIEPMTSAKKRPRRPAFLDGEL